MGKGHGVEINPPPPPPPAAPPPPPTKVQEHHPFYWIKIPTPDTELLKHDTVRQSVYTQLIGPETICSNAFLFHSLASYFLLSSWSILNDRSHFDIKKKKINLASQFFFQISP